MSGAPSPDASYVGRVVIELWENQSASDSQNIAFTSDAANGEAGALLQRISSALVQRVAQTPNISSFGTRGFASGS
jgi:hypothetical protein